MLKKKSDLFMRGLSDLDALVVIQTTRATEPENATEERPDPQQEPGGIVYFIDGLKVEPGAHNDLDPGTIKSITVLKDTEKLRATGLEKYDGAIYIITKEGKKSPAVKRNDIKPLKSEEFRNSEGNVIRQAYFLDGVRTTYNEIGPLLNAGKPG